MMLRRQQVHGLDVVGNSYECLVCNRISQGRLSLKGKLRRGQSKVGALGNKEDRCGDESRIRDETALNLGGGVPGTVNALSELSPG